MTCECWLIEECFFFKLDAVITSPVISPSFLSTPFPCNRTKLWIEIETARFAFFFLSF